MSSFYLKFDDAERVKLCRESLLNRATIVIEPGGEASPRKGIVQAIEEDHHGMNARWRVTLAQ